MKRCNSGSNVNLISILGDYCGLAIGPRLRTCRLVISHWYHDKRLLHEPISTRFFSSFQFHPPLSHEERLALNSRHRHTRVDYRPSYRKLAEHSAQPAPSKQQAVSCAEWFQPLAVMSSRETLA